jgi:hypothetical protein
VWAGHLVATLRPFPLPGRERKRRRERRRVRAHRDVPPRRGVGSNWDTTPRVGTVGVGSRSPPVPGPTLCASSHASTSDWRKRTARPSLNPGKRPASHQSRIVPVENESKGSKPQKVTPAMQARASRCTPSFGSSRIRWRGLPFTRPRGRCGHGALDTGPAFVEQRWHSSRDGTQEAPARFRGRDRD